MNKNIQILSVEAKDIVSNRCAITDKLTDIKVEELKGKGYRILKKYKGSMDYSLLTIYLQNLNKKIVKFNKENHRFYSNDIITVNFNYNINNDDIFLEDEKDERYNSILIVLDVLKAEKSILNKVRNSILSKINRLNENVINDVIDTDLNEFILEVTKDEIAEINENIKSELIIINQCKTKQEMDIFNNLAIDNVIRMDIQEFQLKTTNSEIKRLRAYP